MSSKHQACRFNDWLMVKWRKTVHSKHGVRMMKRAIYKRERREGKAEAQKELKEIADERTS